MNRNFEKFEVGHWYIFTGTENDDGIKDWVESKKVLLDHKPAKCVAVRDKDSLLSFDRVVGGFWSYVITKDLFIEIEDPNLEYSCAPGEYFYSESVGVRQYGSGYLYNANLTKGEHYKLCRPPLEKWGINMHLSDAAKDPTSFHKLRNLAMTENFRILHENVYEKATEDIGLTVQQVKERMFPFVYTSPVEWLSGGCMVGSEFIPFIGVDMARLVGDCTAPFYHNISRKRKARLKPRSEPMRGLK